MRRELSREELFALVWERPTSEVAKELGVSDVALAKLCKRLQVPKPPRGYWAKVQSGRTPRRPPLAAFVKRSIAAVEKSSVPRLLKRYRNSSNNFTTRQYSTCKLVESMSVPAKSKEAGFPI